MDANGNVTEAAAHDDKNTAEKHTATQDPEVEEVTELFKGLTKKKKSSSKKSKSADDDADGAAAADTEAGADSLDLSKMKKKKKKSKKEGTDFETKLAEAGLTEQQAAQVADEKPPSPEEIADDLENARGIWAHDATTAIPYNFLVTRFYSLVSNNHPDLLLSGSKSYKIPPPQCLREGNRRTIFANIADICKRMKRSEEHVMQFLFAELGTSGSVDGAGRLVIKGRFQQKQIENVLRRYIVEYVTCKTCRSPDTELNKGENRLYFVTCNSCGSRRSVAAIKYGFRGQVGRRKRQG
ncbi:eukaryotic translation initiation factor 2 beta subunit [Ascosphaera apis ARSEF 7405]|uniref:Eukaryotic translation initiation factor 2 beta subunit n=1 Tax=Ascosphaera apis ARSEF 7405 TaxID=392613 RepID=A0A167YXD7_9EURO|nr:eukaryotic translation initiation factor 2 beta subunit [Ascosphaera apis ARSEF 7405]